ncbi:MAG: DUF934 domain-containing protein [Pseudomonadota bacterium]
MGTESNTAMTEAASGVMDLESWREAGRPADKSVLIPGDADLDLDYPALVKTARITVEFPVFMDGRGFSHARKLRDLGFDGEIIAAGDVLPDQWEYLRRVGFTGLADGSVSDSAKDLQAFSQPYQADTLHDLPLFKRVR